MILPRAALDGRRFRSGESNLTTALVASTQIRIALPKPGSPPSVACRFRHTTEPVHSACPQTTLSAGGYVLIQAQNHARRVVISVIALLLCFGILLSPTGANAGAGGVLTAQRDSRSADLEAHMAATDDTPADIDAELLTDVAGSDETASPDSASGPVEIVVRFADPGVPSAAAGDPEAAVAALQSLEQQRWDLVEEGLRALDAPRCSTASGSRGRFS